MMHKLIDFICDELTDLEKKADNGGLNLTEVQYADTLAHLKKNLLKAEQMEEESEYSNRGNSMRGMPIYYGNSYAGRRNARRDSMGRYSRDGMAHQLREMMEDAPDEQTRRDMERLASRMESM